MKKRYLTKSRFKLGVECPTKLYYTNKENYADNKLEDAFLEALAEGGYQVGELAKQYFPGGHDIEDLDHETAEAKTNELISQDRVIVFEPAISYENLFVRIDILVKNGNHFDLIEVKSKSYDSKDPNAIIGKKRGIGSTWQPYIYDVAFQNYVLSKAFPAATINNYLMLVDKNVVCSTEGLNQKFLIKREGNRKGIVVNNSLSPEDLEHEILIKVPVDEAVRILIEKVFEDGMSFEEKIHSLSNAYKNDFKIKPKIGVKCKSKNCQFFCTEEQETTGLMSGFKECWSEALGWMEDDFQDPNVLDVWDFRSAGKLIQEGRIKMSALTENDFNIKTDDKPGLTASERRWMQVVKAVNDDSLAFFDKEGMMAEMATWEFPLHFIDFETCTVPIPFTKGRKPYEGVAFQFSHHKVYESGRIEHATQYLDTIRGKFPNFDFIRELKKSLSNDNGTIFRYAPHENTFLNIIYRQIEAEKEKIDDSDFLLEFIKTISHSPKGSSQQWVGPRDMVDMFELVKKYYYNPATKGSNSIKDVLPAILNSSKFLQDKYSQPIYGAEGGISSLNFSDYAWVEIKDGKVINPYKKLPKLFEEISVEEIDRLYEQQELNDGGAASMAYSRMQFGEMDPVEKEAVENGLLKYCELDTLAMVMIYEAWMQMSN